MEWSTESVPPAERFDVWREVTCRSFFRLTPERRKTREPFWATLQAHPLSEGAVTHILSTGQVVERSEADIVEDPTASVCLNAQITGIGHVSQRGDSTVLVPGRACLVTTSEPFTLSFDDDFHQVAVHLPRTLIDPYLPENAPVGRALPDSSLTTLAIGYAQTAHLAPPTSDAARHLVRHLCEVVGSALAEPIDPELPPPQRALLKAAINAINDDLTESDLSPATVANRLSVSVRTVHNLFRGHTATFGHEVLQQRLHRARLLLTDPARAGLRIVDIAAESGFNDRSHFHRCFRAAFGETPAAYRARQSSGPSIR